MGITDEISSGVRYAATVSTKVSGHNRSPKQYLLSNLIWDMPYIEETSLS